MQIWRLTVCIDRPGNNQFIYFLKLNFKIIFTAIKILFWGFLANVQGSPSINIGSSIVNGLISTPTIILIGNSSFKIFLAQTVNYSTKCELVEFLPVSSSD